MKDLRLYCGSVLVVMLLCFSQLHPAHAQEVMKLRTQPGIAGWAVDQNSGQLFAAWPGNESVLQFNLAGKLQRLQKVDGKPMWLAVRKKQLFVVNEGGGLSCFAIQDERLKELSCRGIGSLAALPPVYSESDDSFLYFLALKNAAEARGRRDPGAEIKIVKFDVNRKMVVGEKPFQTEFGSQIFSTHSVDPTSLSPNGKHLFVQTSFGGQLYRFDEATLSLTTGQKLRRSRSTARNFICNFDQSGQYLSYGSMLTRLSDFANVEFFGRVVQVHPKYDLAVSVSEKDKKGKFRLFFQRFSDRKLLKIMQLSGTPRDQSPRDSEQQSLLRFTINDKLWLALDDDAWLVSLDRMNLPKQKSIDVDIPPIEVTSGSNLAFDLTTKKPAGNDDISWELLEGPEGLSLEGDRLVWAPNEDQKGSFKVSLRLTSGDQAITKSINVSVVSEIAPIDVGGEIAELQVNLVGDVVLCRTDTRGRNRYVAIDLNSSEVLSSCEIDSPLRNTVLTKKYLYYVERERDWMLMRRPLNDLGTEESQDLLTQIRSLGYYTNDQLALSTGEPEELFRIPADAPKIPRREEFTPDLLVKSDNRIRSTSNFGAGGMPTRSSSHFSQISEQCLYVNGVVRDAASGKPMTIVDNLHLPIYVDKDAKLDYRYRDISSMPLPFGNIIDYEEKGIGSPKKVTIFQMSPFSARLSRSHLRPELTRMKSLSQYMPVTFSCVLTDTSLSVTANSNVGNKRVASAELESGVFEPSDLRAKPVAYKDGLVVAFENRIHLFKISGDQKAGLPEPLQIAFPAHSEITASTRETIQLETVGGVGDVRFNKLNSGDAMLLNEKTGEIVIDTTELVCGYDRLKMPGALNDAAALAPLNVYNDLFGTRHIPNSELGLYPVSVEARDSIGQRTKICFFVAISRLKASGFENDKATVAIPPSRPRVPKPGALDQPAKPQDGVANSIPKNTGDLAEQEKKIESLESTSKSIEQQLKGIEALLRQEKKTRGN